MDHESEDQHGGLMTGCVYVFVVLISVHAICTWQKMKNLLFFQVHGSSET